MKVRERVLRGKKISYLSRKPLPLRKPFDNLLDGLISIDARLQRIEEAICFNHDLQKKLLEAWIDLIKFVKKEITKDRKKP